MTPCCELKDCPDCGGTGFKPEIKLDVTAQPLSKYTPNTKPVLIKEEPHIEPLEIELTDKEVKQAVTAIGMRNQLNRLLANPQELPAKWQTWVGIATFLFGLGTVLVKC